MRVNRMVVAAIALVAIIAGTSVAVFSHALASHAEGQPSHAGSGVPSYQHIFYIVMENHAYEQIIGNSAAPQINALAQQYGLATNYYGVTHPSQPNYVASVGGSFFGIQDDNAYWTRQQTAASLFSQLEQAGLSGKTYQQSLPSVGFTGENYPFGAVPGAQDKLYAAKHNPIVNFLAHYGPAPTGSASAEFPTNFTPNAAQQAELNKMVPDTQLATDLASGNVPNFSYIVPDQCHDMHGTTSCPSDSTLIPAGDAYVAQTVSAIMSSSVWQRGNNAIVVTWDEDDFSTTNLGCCDANPGGGHVATIVIANHGPRGVQDATPYNHYSLLQTVQDAFHLSCLQNTCDKTNVTPLTRLFATVD